MSRHGFPRAASRAPRPASAALRTVIPLALLGTTRCTDPSGPSRAGAGPGSLLVEITAEAGLEAAPPDWPDGRYRIPEITSCGLAVFDADADGDLDIYQVLHPPPPRPEAAAPNRLWLRGDDGRYREAPGARGLDDPGYGNGVAVGDANGDGRLDVFVANLGRDALYIGTASGRWEDATERAGVSGGDRWSTSAAFFDADLDGDLDLWVCRYLVDDPSRICRPGAAERRDYCGPARYRSVPDTLWRNDGTGRFRDASREAGIAVPRAGLGVLCLDLTGDGRLDVYVANDKQPNQLWVNRGGGRFVDEAARRGMAVSGNGQVEASMGIAPGDIDGDGRFDLLLTHLVNETATLYQSSGKDGWDDRSASSGLGARTLATTGWGCGFVDLDHDGDLDLPLVNGRIARGRERRTEELGSFWSPYAEPAQVFLQVERGRFREASGRAGRFGDRATLARCLALGDLDRDGDVDLVASGLAGRLRLYRNDAPPDDAHWLRVRPLDGATESLGAVVACTAGGRRHLRPILRSYGYATSHEPVAAFGLGQETGVERLEVTWPGGERERFAVEAVDRELAVRRGEGEALGR